MSDVIAAAVNALQEKISSGFDAGIAKIEIPGEGSILIDSEGIRAGEGDAEVTLTADADTFQEMLSGELDPTAAFMTQRLSVEGDMGLAMQLGTLLS
ncbi:MAG: SCP2 sterol-binding domain-containing protein [Pseudomonadota bacterium]